MTIVQNEITDYLSINVTEDETPWVDSSLYDYADEVRYGHYIYKYAGEDNTNTITNPESTWNLYKDTYSVWVKIGTTNFFSALDDKTLTQTLAPDSLIIELTNDSFDTISLLNLKATDVNLQLINLTTAEIYLDKNYDLQDTSIIVDEKTYWYAPFDFGISIYDQNIYLIPNTKIKITINYSGANAGVGRIIAGRSLFWGDSILPATLDQQTYSRFNTDIFGNTELIQGESVKMYSYNIKAPLDKMPYLERKRKELTAIPLLFVMDESNTSKIANGLVYGYFMNAPINISNASSLTMPINIKGLV